MKENALNFVKGLLGSTALGCVFAIFASILNVVQARGDYEEVTWQMLTPGFEDCIKQETNLSSSAKCHVQALNYWDKAAREAKEFAYENCAALEESEIKECKLFVDNLYESTQALAAKYVSFATRYDQFTNEEPFSTIEYSDIKIRVLMNYVIVMEFLEQNDYVY